MPPSLACLTPPLPFAPDIGFVGDCAADGQRTRVAALGLDAEYLVLLSLVGYETSINAACAKLMHGERIGFLPDRHAIQALAPEWETTTLKRHPDLSYWLWRSALRGTKQRNGMLVPHTLSLAWSHQHPPVVPAPRAQPETTPSQPHAPPIAAPVYAPRYLVAARDEHDPPYPRFFGHLRGLRVVLPPSVAWVAYLWERSLETALLVPLPALGVRLWRMDGDPHRWNALATEGIRRGVLTATPPTDSDKRALGLLCAPNRR